MQKQSQDTFIVGKSKFPQCKKPKCFYHQATDSDFCRKHKPPIKYTKLTDGYSETVTVGTWSESEIVNAWGASD